LWLTLVLDVFSRAVMGFYLSFRAPSMTSVARALTMAVSDKTKLMAQWGLSDLEWPMRGVPLVVHTDHGPEFHSRGYERGCQEHGITPRWRMATRWGGHIERLIGTLMGKLHLLPGTTFSNVPQRIKYQPQARAVMTVSDILRFMVATICEYHETKHRSLGVTPRMRWEEGQSLVPPNCLRAPTWPKFLWDFLPPQTSSRQRDGLHWGGYTYNSNLLLPIPVRTQVSYRVDPWNTRVALVEMPNGLYSEVPRVTATSFDHHELERQFRICKGAGASAADITARKERSASKRKSIVKQAKIAAETQQSALFSITSASIGAPVASQPEQIILPSPRRPGVFVRPAVVFNTTRI
jgi:putative transposase